MDIFDKTIVEVREYLEKRDESIKTLKYNSEVNWEKDKSTNIIMENCTAIELGHPSKESVYFLVWTQSNESLINDGNITVIGKDINEINENRSSFAEVILVKGHGFNDENAYDRYLELDLIKRQLALKGYMVRAVPQRMVNWSRVSKEAKQKGFSFQTLGSEMIKRLKELEYVDEVEIIYNTSEDQDIKGLKSIGRKVTKSVQAMNKMIENLQYDCKSCEFEDVCEEFGELKAMHKKQVNAIK